MEGYLFAVCIYFKIERELKDRGMSDDIAKGVVHLLHRCQQ
jgi:hypothetical protein